MCAVAYLCCVLFYVYIGSFSLSLFISSSRTRIWLGSGLLIFTLCATKCVFSFRFLLSPVFFICLVYLSFGEHARKNMTSTSHSYTEEHPFSVSGARRTERRERKVAKTHLFFRCSCCWYIWKQIHMGSKVQQIAYIPFFSFSSSLMPIWLDLVDKKEKRIIIIIVRAHSNRT